MKIKDMMFTAIMAAVIAVLGLLPPIPLPFIPVPITVQTLGVMLAGSILGARLGGVSLLLFVVLIGLGAPLLSGGRGAWVFWLDLQAGMFLVIRLLLL